RQPLITQRAALILISALLIGVTAGVLSHIAGSNPAAAVLAGGAACAGAIVLLDALVGLRVWPAPPCGGAGAPRCPRGRAAPPIPQPDDLSGACDYDRTTLRPPGAFMPGERALRPHAAVPRENRGHRG